MNCIAIIPVRGGSRGIPRKNARILYGKPLLAYTIETALNAETINKVYVSTDDAELAEIARRYGAHVLERPVALAADQIGLDSVMVDAVRQLENNGEVIDYLISIQATSPLLRSETINRAVRKCVEEKLDTVLSVVNDTHLNWQLNAEGNLIPMHKERVNRQYLSQVFRETGGVVVARRSTLNNGSRFGQRVGFIELEKAEALDIDDRFDWWTVEKSLVRRRICFYVIGNIQDGLGHVNRALTLADRLIDHDLLFIVNEEAELARKLIEQRFYRLCVVKKGEEVEGIIKEKPDLLVNDILDTSEEYMLKLRKLPGLVIVNFEDLGPGSRYADFVVNEMYNHHAIDDRKILQGIAYCCLRDEFYSVDPIRIKTEVKNVLLAFGGTDPHNLTMVCLKWLDKVPSKYKITVILGFGYPYREMVEEYCKTSIHDIEIVVNSAIVSRYMANADLAISSAGRTVFELSSLGIPIIVIAQNERELMHAFARESTGVVNLGLATKLPEQVFYDTLKQLLDSPVLRTKMHEVLLAADIRSGINRVLKVIAEVLK